MVGTRSQIPTSRCSRTTLSQFPRILNAKSIEINVAHSLGGADPCVVSHPLQISPDKAITEIVLGIDGQNRIPDRIDVSRIHQQRGILTNLAQRCSRGEITGIPDAIASIIGIPNPSAQLQ